MEYKDYVFVVDHNGNPCNPIENGKARYLLSKNYATIINHEPFVIQRNDEYEREFEDDKKFVLKIDMGYKHIGFSVTNEFDEVICGSVSLLEGMSQRLSERSRYRRDRRNRLRYRRNKNIDVKTVNNPNYKNGNEDGWFAPSIRHKMDTHERLVDKLTSWIPVDHIELEVANFDIQQMKADLKNYEMQGKDYQNGEMKGYDNVKLYIKERDKYTCQNCKVCITDGDVHHIIPKSWGGSNRPGNLIYLCKSCHDKCHMNNNDNDLFRSLQRKKIDDSYKEATFMNTVRWAIYDSLGEKLDVESYFGYETNRNRNRAELPKFHHNDAVCINTFTNTSLAKSLFLVEQIKCNDRSMKDFSDAKYIDRRTGKVETGSTLKKIRKPNSSKRSTRKEDIENLRVFRAEKIKSGSERHFCHSYCLKHGDLIKVYKTNRICEVMTVQTDKKTNKNTGEISTTYRIRYKNPDMDSHSEMLSISISPDEYERLKTTGKCSRFEIVRTRRGMIWRTVDRQAYEKKYGDQYQIDRINKEEKAAKKEMRKLSKEQKKNNK